MTWDGITECHDYYIKARAVTLITSLVRWNFCFDRPLLECAPYSITCISEKVPLTYGYHRAIASCFRIYHGNR